MTGFVPQVSSQAPIHVHERKKDRDDLASSSRHSGSSRAADTNGSARTSKSPALGFVISICARLDMPHPIVSPVGCPGWADLARRCRINPVSVNNLDTVL